MTLGESGQIVVSDAAARQYAAARRLGIEEARRELTALLMDARQTRSQPVTGAEGWRRRSRTHHVDIDAHVDRQGRLAVVTHVHVRPLQPRGRNR